VACAPGARGSEVGRSTMVDDTQSASMIEAIIFDLDGLLIDSEQNWERARRDYARSVGCDWTAEDELAAKGLNSPEWAALIQQRCGLRSTEREVISGVTDRMKELYDQSLPVLPGAVSVVENLAERYPLAVASSSPPEIIEHVLKEAGIRHCFSVVVSADEVGKGKPSPDVFLVTAERLQRDPHRIVVFEDSSAGILAAHAAGMHVIAIPNLHYPPSEEALSKADLVLDSLLNFRPDLLFSLGNDS
jgi:HAD superfamily hydrolase (TIGR01509 family)